MSLVKDSIESIQVEIASISPGTEVTLKILRGDVERTVTVELGKLEPEKAPPAVKQKLEELFGFGVKTLNDNLAQEYNLDSSLKGVVVTNIDQASPAYRAGFKEGDLIIAVNRQKIENIKQFNKIAQNLEEGDSVFFRVVRRNRTFFVAFTL